LANPPGSFRLTGGGCAPQRVADALNGPTHDFVQAAAPALRAAGSGRWREGVSPTPPPGWVFGFNLSKIVGLQPACNGKKAYDYFIDLIFQLFQC